MDKAANRHLESFLVQVDKVELVVVLTDVAAVLVVAQAGDQEVMQ